MKPVHYSLKSDDKPHSSNHGRDIQLCLTSFSTIFQDTNFLNSYSNNERFTAGKHYLSVSNLSNLNPIPLLFRTSASPCMLRTEIFSGICSSQGTGELTRPTNIAEAPLLSQYASPHSKPVQTPEMTMMCQCQLTRWRSCLTQVTANSNPKCARNSHFPHLQKRNLNSDGFAKPIEMCLLH